MSEFSSWATAAITRRQFANASAGLAITAGAVTLAQAQSATTVAQDDGSPKGSLIKPRAVILFQGDSITDAGRSREEIYQPNTQPALGNGYAWLAASQLLVDRPDDNLTIFNRGISGNKVYQLAERWQTDALNLKPNVLSILIGVNDIWHKLNGNYDGTVEKYETDYKALIKRTKEALPDVSLVICEPFVLRCGAVTSTWFPEFDTYRAAAKRVAKEFRAVFVPFQETFDRASKLAPPERWAKDGVHPSADGAALMAHTWRRCVNGNA
jgi:lysophospholipase L1-like esterase